MSENNFGTIKGQIITPEILDEYSLRFEQNWQDSEVIVKPTRYGKALEALQSLEMSVGEEETSPLTNNKIINGKTDNLCEGICEKVDLFCA